MKLLFLNSLKGLKNKKIQMVGIIILVMLSTGIYTLMNASLDRMEDSYYEYLDNQNVEDVAVHVNINYEKDISLDDLNYLLNNQLSNLTNEEQNNFDLYKCAIDSKCKNKENIFDNISFKLVIEKIFKKYDADTYIQSKKLSSLQDKYDFDYEVTRSKSLKKDNDIYLKVIPYNANSNINVSYLVKGRFPINENEITILPKYAEINNIELGDKYIINDIEYKIVGLAYAPDYIYPLVSYSALIFDEEKNNIIYVNNNNYNNIIGVEEKVFSIAYNNAVRQFEFNYNSDTNKGPFAIFNDESNYVIANPFTTTRIMRISSPQLEFSSDRLFAQCFLYLLLAISVMVIAIVTKKRIDDERLQIGVLKSLGYNPFNIAVSYLIYPIIGSLIGGLIGYFIGFSYNGILTKQYINFFLIPLTKFDINIKDLLECIFVPMILLSLLSYLIALFMLRKKPLDLLKEGSNLKVNIFSKTANKITHKLPFKYRFKYNLAFRSISKLLIIAITSLFAGMLIILTLIGFNLMQNVVDKSFNGMEYKYMVYTYTIGTNEFDDSTDYLLTTKLVINKIFDKNSNEKKIDDNIIIEVQGIDFNSKYIKLLNENNNNIIGLLNEKNSIIINKNVQKLYEIEIGDILVLLLDENSDKTISYKVVGVTEQYMNVIGYTNRLNLSNDIGYRTSAYNMFVSNNDNYNNLSNLEPSITNNIAVVINFSDMKDNINKSFKKYNASIYIVILFASIIAFVIIAVIANIVIEENKKIISLMKVMGYKNKKISSIVLNIYTPIIIIFYFLSIPITIAILKKIISLITGDIKMIIPITLNPYIAIIGLICLLISYYIAIWLSKKVLNKIPLSIALKRE